LIWRINSETENVRAAFIAAHHRIRPSPAN
jgi:hypothetical protein